MEVREVGGGRRRWGGRGCRNGEGLMISWGVGGGLEAPRGFLVGGVKRGVVPGGRSGFGVGVTGRMWGNGFGGLRGVRKVRGLSWERGLFELGDKGLGGCKERPFLPTPKGGSCSPVAAVLWFSIPPPYERGKDRKGLCCEPRSCSCTTRCTVQLQRCPWEGLQARGVEGKSLRGGG